MRDSFIIYSDYYNHIKDLTLEQKGLLLEAIFVYQREGREIELEPVIKMAFSFIKTDLDINAKKWEEVVQKRSEAGKRSGEVRRNKKNEMETQQTSVQFTEQNEEMETKRTVNVNNNINGYDNDDDNGNETVNSTLSKERVSKPTHKFSPPSLAEVQAYCLERSNYVSPSKFINYYQSNGWMIGKNPMKDWRAAVRKWESSEECKPQKGFY